MGFEWVKNSQTDQVGKYTTRSNSMKTLPAKLFFPEKLLPHSDKIRDSIKNYKKGEN
jgi:hypothetical protein